MTKKDEKEELVSLLVIDAAWILANHQENKETRIQVAVGIVNVKAVGLLTQEVPLTKWGNTVLKVHLRTVFLTSLVVLVVTDQAISEAQEWQLINTQRTAFQSGDIFEQTSGSL